MSWQEFFSDEPELAKEGFEETVRTYLKEHPEIVDQNSGNLTNRERGKLECSITLDPKFKQEMKEICNKIKGETNVRLHSRLRISACLWIHTAHQGR